MLKIGVIGLGDIARKAYLPILNSKEIEIHLYTRNEATLSHIGAQYRLNNIHKSLDSLIESGIRAAFVHVPTIAHHAILEQLLSHNIHVYVDKPITYDYSSSEKLVALAENKNLVLMVGFNRRYAPAYQKVKTLREPNMIIMQKNRNALPGEVRTFIFDDFIHVVDTLLFLFPFPVEKMIVAGKKKGNLLYHVIVHFISAEGTHAIGIMNRDSGTIEEKVEVFTSGEKRVVYNVSELVIHKDKNETKIGLGDWDTTLYKRGFVQIVEYFLAAVESGITTQISNQRPLLSHKICEEVVRQLNAMPS